jgi:Fur family zinc uptake transcriptional regulator
MKKAASHKKEIEKLLKHVESYCEKHGIRFTEPRRHVLEIIATHPDRPLGAYDILEKMAKILKDPKPMTVYRAIDFLSEHGFIHRIESLNAFVSCHAGHTHNGSQFMVCDSCGTVEEVHLCDLPNPFQKKVAEKKFKLSHWNAELHGTCGKCQA